MYDQILNIDEACEFLGIKRRTIYKLLKDGNLPASKLNYAIESLNWGNSSYQYEVSVEEGDGEHWYNTVVTGQYDASGILKAITVVQRDITERQKAERELREINAALAESKMRVENMMHELENIRDELQFALDAAKEADRMKSEFLANTSRELRTPLNSIIGFLKLVLDDLCDSPEEEREFLQNALSSSNLLLSLINDVLDIAKIEAGKMEILPEAVKIKNIFDKIFTLTHVQTEQKKLFLKTNLSDEELTVLADSQKLRQIMLNLVGNSVKFTSFGGIEIAARIDGEADKAVIDVIDTGVGIAVEKQERVFEKFTQADGSTSRKYGGTGLGLTITKSLIELMGGKITLFSEGRGQGTTMSFTMPLFRGQENREDTEPQAVTA